MVKYLLIFALGACITYSINFKPDDTPKPEVKVVTKVVTNPGIPEEFRVFHDARRGVTCYYKAHSNAFPSSALSCVPDAQLRISQ